MLVIYNTDPKRMDRGKFSGSIRGVEFEVKNPAHRAGFSDDEFSLGKASRVFHYRSSCMFYLPTSNKELGIT